ncbi:MAG: ribonuclease P protein component [Candidatus Brocadiaceae bacterium]|nr:ribonuclease P protein component [Candidatus Brocadiaceae bacterium]
MPEFGFPRQARLLTEGDFRRVYTGRARRLQEPPLRVCALRRDEGGSRLGLSIGRKVGNSVVRNRWKRAVRQAFRLNRHRLHAPHDLVVSVDWAAGPERVGEVEPALLRIIERLNGGREADDDRP